MIGWIVLGIVVLVVLYAIVTYNGMVRGRNKVDEGWSGIDVQLKRRHDLIGNLVETVKGYASHESGVFEEVTAARAAVTKAAASGTVEQKAEASAALDKSLVNVMAVAENYPDLKASTNFLDLQKQLTDTENQLSFARQSYNDAVSSLNTAVVTFPSMLFAGMAGVAKRTFYTAPEGQTAPPQVKF